MTCEECRLVDRTISQCDCYTRGETDTFMVMYAAIEQILDGRDIGQGTSSLPWEPLRRRLIALVAGSESQKKPINEVRCDHVSDGATWCRFGMKWGSFGMEEEITHWKNCIKCNQIYQD